MYAQRYYKSDPVPLGGFVHFHGRRGKLSIISGDGLTGIPSVLLSFEAPRQTALLILKSSRPASSLLSERAILSLQFWCMDEQSASLLSSPQDAPDFVRRPS